MNTEQDNKSTARDAGQLIRSLMEHALSDLRLAELTASQGSLWHSADDCRNARIAIEKLLSTRLEGE
jgi:hypothetical protein